MKSFENVSGFRNVGNAMTDIIDYETVNKEILDKDIEDALIKVKEKLSEKLTEENEKVKEIETFFLSNLKKPLELLFINPKKEQDFQIYNVILSSYNKENGLFFGLIEKFDSPYYISLKHGSIDILELCETYNLEVKEITAAEVVNDLNMCLKSVVQHFFENLK